MSVRTYLLVIFILFTEILFTQEGFRIVMDIDGGTERGRHVSTYPNGDILVFGEYISSLNPIFGSVDLILSKLSSGGELIWSKAIGTNLSEYPLKVITLSNGNIGLKVCQSTGLPSFERISISILLGYDGDIIWSKSMSRGGLTYEMSNGDLLSLQSTDESEELLGGIITRFSAAGEMLWSRALETLNSTQSLLFQDCTEIPNGKILVAGTSRGLINSFSSGWLIEYTNDGEIINEYLYSPPTGSVYFKKLVSDEFGNLYISGQINNGGGIYGLLLKLDSDYNILWQKKLSKEDTQFDYGFDYKNGVCSRSFMNHQTDSLITYKFQSNGDLVWASKNKLNILQNYHFSDISSIDADGNSYIFYTSQDIDNSNNMSLIKLDSEGHSGCEDLVDIGITNTNLLKTTVNSVSNDLPISLSTNSNFQSIDIP